MERFFKNTSDALKYLQDQGFSLKKSKLYQDVSRGKLRKLPDGRLTLADVVDYADRCLTIKTPDFECAKSLSIEEKRRRVGLLQAREEKILFENALARGQYLERDAVLTEFCAKLGLIDTVFKNGIRSRVAEWLISLDADPEKGPALFSLFETEIDKLMDQMADMETIQVRVRRNPEAVNQ